MALPVGGPANRPDAAILHDLDSVPGILFVITHELSEMTLIIPGNPLALGDYTATWGFAHHTLLHWTFKYHTLKVKAIRPGSPSAAAGLPTGATILEINGQPVSDLFDYEWRLFEATEARLSLSVTWSHQGKQETRMLSRAFGR